MERKAKIRLGLQGAASAFDLTGSTIKNRRRVTHVSSNLATSWKNVGGYFRKSMDKVGHEQ